jgi:hypothetical protein
MSKPIPTVDELMAESFAPGRDQRSAEYKAGVRSILERRIHVGPAKFSLLDARRRWGILSEREG